MVDEVRPGDRVTITGIFKVMGVRVKPNQRKLKNVYRTYVDVITYTKVDVSRVNLKDSDANKMDHEQPRQNEMEVDDQADHAEGDQGLQQDHETFTEKEIKEFKQFAQSRDLYEQLVDSLAPSIWENEDVKKGILTQLFGGVSKEFSASG